VADKSTGQKFINELKSLVDAATYWEVKAGNGSTDPYVMIGPKSGSAIINCKIIVAHSLSSGSMAMFHSNTTGRHTAIGANGIGMGVAPEGGSLSGYNSLTPFGGSSRFTGYVPITMPDISSGTVAPEHLWLIESNETIAICNEDVQAGSNRGIRCCHAGAISEPVSPNGGEADGRIWGLTGTGEAEMADTCWTDQGAFPGGTYESDGYATTLLFDPGASDLTPIVMLRNERYTVGSAGLGTLTDRSGARIALPVTMSEKGNNYAFYGSLKQVRACSEYTVRTLVKVGSATKMVVLGSRRSDSTDAVAFCND
jgi:hypothetical protein